MIICPTLNGVVVTKVMWCNNNCRRFPPQALYCHAETHGRSCITREDMLYINYDCSPWVIDVFPYLRVLQIHKTSSIMHIHTYNIIYYVYNIHTCVNIYMLFDYARLRK